MPCSDRAFPQTKDTHSWFYIPTHGILLSPKENLILHYKHQNMGKDHTLKEMIRSCLWLVSKISNNGRACSHIYVPLDIHTILYYCCNKIPSPLFIQSIPRKIISTNIVCGRWGFVNFTLDRWLALTGGTHQHNINILLMTNFFQGMYSHRTYTNTMNANCLLFCFQKYFQFLQLKVPWLDLKEKSWC